MQLPVIERMKKELGDLQHELAHDIPAKLEEARAHGDLRENAEYDAAKNRQGVLRARIAQLQTRIRELSVFSIAQVPRDRVSYGSVVTLEDDDTGDRHEYRLVFPEEVDGTPGLISIASPMGQALMNRSEGDEVKVQTPRGRRSFQVLGVVTLHERRESVAPGDPPQES